MSENNKLPLEIIRDWLGTLQEPTSSILAFHLIIHIRDYDVMDESEKWLAEWLSEKLDYFQHAGRAIIVRTLVDYILGDFATEAHWDRATNTHLTAVDTGSIPAYVRSFFNENLSKLPAARDAWMKAADSWRVVREKHLTDESIRAWESSLAKQF